MKIKNGFILSEVGGNTVTVATGELSRRFPGALIMNPSGKFLFELLSSRDHSKEELLAAMLNEYNVSIDKAKADIDVFITKLRNAGVLEEN